MSTVGRLINNIASSWFGLLVNIVVSFFLAPFVVHGLGNVYYGIWAITLQFTGYLYLLDFGVRDSVIRYTSKYSAQSQANKLNRVLTTALIIYTPIFFLCVIVALIAAWQFPYWFVIDPQLTDTTRIVVLLVGLTIAQTFIFNVFKGIIQGLHRFDIVNIFGVGVALVRAALIVVAINYGYGIIALSVIQLSLAIVSGLFTTFVAFSFLKRAGMEFQLIRMPWRRFIALARRVFGYSYYVFINNIGQKVVQVSDAVIIGIFMPIASVTFYAIAGSLVGYLRNLAIATAQAFAPLTSHYASLRDTKNIHQVLIRGSRLSIFVSLPVIVAYTIMGREFIGLWMGAEYMKLAGDVLFILAITYIFSSPHHVISGVLHGLSLHRNLAHMRIVEAITKLSLSIFLVQQIGLIGVALGTAIPHVVMTAIILPIMVTRAVKLPLLIYLRGAYVGPLLAITPFIAGAVYFKEQMPAQNLLIFFSQILLLLIVYLVVGYWLAIDRDERTVVKHHLSRIYSAIMKASGNEKNSIS